MGLIQIVKDKYTLWHYERAVEKDRYTFLITEKYIKLTKQFDDALTRERNRLFASFQKKYPRENYSEKTA
jgi:competence CoiA-like predicted nuclease